MSGNGMLRVRTGPRFIVYLGRNDRSFQVTDCSHQLPDLIITDPPGLAMVLCTLFTQETGALIVHATVRRGTWALAPYGGDGFIVAFEVHDQTFTVTVLFCQKQEREYRQRRDWMTEAERHALDQRCLDLHLPEEVARDPVIITGWPALCLCAGRWHLDGQRAR